MADFHFEETCPCGDSIKVSGYGTHVQPQIQAWRTIHTRHTHAILKAKIKDMEKWVYPAYIWPATTGVNGSFTYNTETTSAGSETKD